jgi:phosphoglycolate phosphatase-like HAD superfamily hydrolase
MSLSQPTVLALDFDGVICDGLKEYFQTAWRAYGQIWQPADTVPPEGLAELFYRLRPVVETGWEMPVLLHAVLKGIPEERIWQEWGAIANLLVVEEKLKPTQIAAEVDGVRDQWIASDPESWLAEHRFYPGVIEQLKGLVQYSPTHLVIISTKEGRFIHQLLQQEGLSLTESQIYGKECKQPKHQILREMIPQYIETATFWFVEDRLKTLQSIKAQPDLQSVRLFLAEWGYNTAGDRQTVQQDSQISLLSLEQFSQPLPTWVPSD